jgi:CheY-like chemotaxis protein
VVTRDEDDRATVLNVEDFEPARFLRSKVLRRAGFNIVEASTAGEALAAVSERVPDVALVDVDLPDADGFFVCDTLKKTHPELPVVLVSAVHVSAQAAHRGRLTGADAFLLEPIAPDVLVTRVMNALEGIRDEASVNWIVTDSVGVILEASPEAGHMLGFAIAPLRGRLLLTFFDGERDEWSGALARACSGQVVERSGPFRPRDRRPMTVTAKIARALHYPIAGAVMWAFGAPPGTP